MRAKNVAKNSTVLAGSYLIISILSFVLRPLIVQYLSSEYLGFDSIVANIITLLSFTESGIGVSLSYRLYEAFSKDDKDEISILTNIYKKAYRVIGLLILVLGIVTVPLIKVLTVNSELPLNIIYISYLIQIGATALNYFVGYYRLVYVSNQKEYVCAIIDTITTTLLLVLQIVAVVVFNNYLLYVLLLVLKTLLPSLVIYIRRIRDYSYIKNVKLTKEQLVKRNFFSDVKNSSIQQIAYVFYGGADNIIVSYFLGLASVASFTNYTVVNGFVTSIINRIYKPLQASIGDFIYSNPDLTKRRELFNSLDLVNSIIAGFVFTGYIVVFQPIITLWMGEKFLLSSVFLLVLSLNCYVGIIGNITYYFRSAFGEFAYDRKFVVVSAVLNIASSLVLGKICGVVGVMVGTLVATSLIVVGRNKYALCEVLKISQVSYYFLQCRRFILTGIEATVAYFCTFTLPVTIPFVVLRCIIVIIITVGIDFFLFKNKPEMQYFLKHFLSVIKLKKGNKKI